MLALIGKKLGMTQLFDEKGTLKTVTVLEVQPNTVVGQRTAEKDGYRAVILGTEKKRKNRILKPYAGQFPEGIEPPAFIKEFRDFEKECKVGEKIGVELFEGIRFVDIQGTSKGKGFQGVIKRHGFAGGRGSHGSKFHREAGSTGTGAFASRTIPGTRMPGRMGAVRKTIQNLRIVRIDRDKGVLYIWGAVPGRRGGRLFILTAKKRR